MLPSLAFLFSPAAAVLTFDGVVVLPLVLATTFSHTRSTSLFKSRKISRETAWMASTVGMTVLDRNKPRSAGKMDSDTRSYSPFSKFPSSSLMRSSIPFFTIVSISSSTTFDSTRAREHNSAVIAPVHFLFAISKSFGRWLKHEKTFFVVDVFVAALLLL